MKVISTQHGAATRAATAARVNGANSPKKENGAGAFVKRSVAEFVKRLGDKAEGAAFNGGGRRNAVPPLKGCKPDKSEGRERKSVAAGGTPCHAQRANSPKQKNEAVLMLQQSAAELDH